MNILEDPIILLYFLVFVFIIISILFYALSSRKEKKWVSFIKLIFSMNLSWLFPHFVIASMIFLRREEEIPMPIFYFTCCLSLPILHICSQYFLYRKKND